jgi:hypothetical protein
LILYIVGFVISFIAWAIATGALTTKAFDRYGGKQEAHHARLAWLAFFLLPLYPAVFIVALVVVPIMVFRRLGRINKEEE